MVVVVCTSSYDAYGNTCIKVYKQILNGFKVVERHYFVTETATYKVQRDVTQNKKYQSRVMVLALCMSSNVD